MKVLIAEDSATPHVTLEQALVGLGHECIVAEDGAMAWELYERHGADLVISDACQRREVDSAYRYGGVELLAVLPEQTLESAALAAERGRLADRLGRRRLFVAGIALFSGASLICGLSQSEGMLLVARGLQGLGGAMVSPAALSIIRTTFAEGTERNRALAVWGAIAGAGGAVGLLLGGAIVQTLSWRWIFFINVPIGAVVLALASRIVPESRPESATGAGYDVEGAVAITLGTMALVFTLIKADSWGWTSGRTLAGLAVAAMLIVAFRGHRAPPR
jgi:Major Facilitator Superfamily